MICVSANELIVKAGKEFQADFPLVSACCVVCKKLIKVKIFGICERCDVVFCSEYCLKKGHDVEICSKIFELKNVLNENKEYPSELALELDEFTNKKIGLQPKNSMEVLALIEATMSIKNQFCTKEYRFMAEMACLSAKRAEIAIHCGLFNQATMILDFTEKNFGEQKTIDFTAVRNRIGLKRALLHYYKNEYSECITLVERLPGFNCGTVPTLLREVEKQNCAYAFLIKVQALYKMKQYNRATQLTFAYETSRAREMAVQYVAYAETFIITELLKLQKIEPLQGGKVCESLDRVLLLIGSESRRDKADCFSALLEYTRFLISKSFLVDALRISARCLAQCEKVFTDDSFEFAELQNLIGNLQLLFAKEAYSKYSGKERKKKVAALMEKSIEAHFLCIGIYRHLFGNDHSVFCNHPNYPQRIKDCVECLEYAEVVANEKI